MKTWLPVIVATLGVAGCATAPADIEPLAVEKSSYTCAQKADVASALLTLSNEQSARRQSDTVSFMLIGLTPSVFSSPKKREDEIARLKGELALLDRTCP